jgi:hypothetical protein
MRFRGDLARTPAVVIASTLACCYALVLAGLGIYLFVLFVAHQGTIGNQVGYLANRGVSEVIVLLIFAALALVVGAIGAWRGTRGLPIIVPLAVIVVVGLIGEPIDIANGDSLGDNLIGAAILVLAVIPTFLLALPRAHCPNVAD